MAYRAGAGACSDQITTPLARIYSYLCDDKTPHMHVPSAECKLNNMNAKSAAGLTLAAAVAGYPLKECDD